MISVRLGRVKHNGVSFDLRARSALHTWLGSVGVGSTTARSLVDFLGGVH